MSLPWQPDQNNTLFLKRHDLIEAEVLAFIIILARSHQSMLGDLARLRHVGSCWRCERCGWGNVIRTYLKRADAFIHFYIQLNFTYCLKVGTMLQYCNIWECRPIINWSRASVNNHNFDLSRYRQNGGQYFG